MVDFYNKRLNLYLFSNEHINNTTGKATLPNSRILFHVCDDLLALVGWLLKFSMDVVMNSVCVCVWL